MTSVVTTRDCSDDKVEEGHLSDGFDLTCRAWDVSLFALHNTRVYLPNITSLVSGCPTRIVGVRCQYAPVETMNLGL